MILWPDTFNNYFHPETAIAAVETLEDAGFDVDIPRALLCCGRPLYDYGMLTTARQYLDRVLQCLGPEIDEGIPIVGLEPSCVAVFRDELPNLLADDPRAQRLSHQVVTLGEFLARHVDRLPPMTLGRRALVHGHCHQKALFGIDGERAVLSRLGVEYDTVDSGCCGMAGAFGFERRHYAVSHAIGERVLLPAVRSAAKETLILADGFSCREQIAQATDRRALHLADVFALARHQLRDAEEFPERGVSIDHSRSRVSISKATAWTVIAIGVALAATGTRPFPRRRYHSSAKPSAHLFSSDGTVANRSPDSA